ncbi:MAG: hypothetical protein U0165_17425 [Polyangiaceae bacterium]
MDTQNDRQVSIWWWAMGYFAAYAPYSAITKALSDGKLGPKVSGTEILPVATMASLGAMLVFLVATGWWRSASKRHVFGVALPFPSRWTALSGICGATIMTTTTLAYTFSGVSIVFMMLLLRGGMLAIAPVVDLVSGRKVRAVSWAATALTLSSLLVGFLGREESFSLPWIAAVDVAAYLTAYFIRLRFMSKLAKSDSAEATKRYFVEEQLVSTPFALLALAILSSTSSELHKGFVELPFSSQAVWAAGIGFLSQGTGIFGALVLLDKSENSFSVPVNRASSLLAGVLATLVLWGVGWSKPLDGHEALGAAMVIAAIGVLGFPQRK